MQNEMINDRELVRQYLQGSHSSFELLVKRHKNKVFSSILFMVRDRDVAHDIFQDTFLKVIECLKNGKYQDENKFSAWVGKIAHNLVIDYFRLNKHMPVVRDNEEFSIFDRMRNNEGNILEQNNRKEIKNELRELVDKLPFTQREVVILRIYSGLSFKEIAQITNVSINTALGRMRYAILNLREKVLSEKENIFLD